MNSIDNNYQPTPYERVMKRLYKIPMMQPENLGLYRITSLLLDCPILDDVNKTSFLSSFLMLMCLCLLK